MSINTVSTFKNPLAGCGPIPRTILQLPSNSPIGDRLSCKMCRMIKRPDQRVATTFVFETFGLFRDARDDPKLAHFIRLRKNS